MTAPQSISPDIDTAAYEDTDDAEVVKVLAAVRHCANSWDGSARLVGNVRARDISRACTAAIAALQPSSAGSEEYRYARDLLVNFVNEHCDPIPEWKPLPDLLGVLTQLDNATTIVRDYKEKLRSSNVAQAEREPTGIEQSMTLLAEVPGETLLDKVKCLKGWYLEMQAMVEKLNKRDHIVSSNRNSYM